MGLVSGFPFCSTRGDPALRIHLPVVISWFVRLRLRCPDGKFALQTEMNQAREDLWMNIEFPLIDHPVEKTDDVQRRLTGGVSAEEFCDGGQT